MKQYIESIFAILFGLGSFYAWNGGYEAVVIGVLASLIYTSIVRVNNILTKI